MSYSRSEGLGSVLCCAVWICSYLVFFGEFNKKLKILCRTKICIFLQPVFCGFFGSNYVMLLDGSLHEAKKNHGSFRSRG